VAVLIGNRPLGGAAVGDPAPAAGISPEYRSCRESRVNRSRADGVVERELGEGAGPFGGDRAEAEQLADCGPARVARADDN